MCNEAFVLVMLFGLISIGGLIYISICTFVQRKYEKELNEAFERGDISFSVYWSRKDLIKQTWF